MELGKEKSLAELKAMIDAAQAGQLVARNELAKRFKVLGFSHRLDWGLNFPHPTEENKSIRLHIQDCYGRPYGDSEENVFRGYFHIDVIWYEPHQCDENCSFDCDLDKEERTRPATAEELVEVLSRDLLKEFNEQWVEMRRDWELAIALPTEEELAKERRRIEDFLRKNPRHIPAVIKLLKKIQEV